MTTIWLACESFYRGRAALIGNQLIEPPSDQHHRTVFGMAADQIDLLRAQNAALSERLNELL